MWLRADPAALGGRVSTGDHRPLLGADPTSDLAAMAAARADLYTSVADLVVDTDEQSATAAAAAIIEWLPDHTRS